MRTIIGIDNGVTGGVTLISDHDIHHFKTPVKKELSYTKKKQWINRIDVIKLKRAIFNAHTTPTGLINTFCLLERPMVNPGRFKATISALRALEATLIVLEQLKLPVQYIDSKEWQKVLLPKGLKGPELKTAANDIAKRLFPMIKIMNADSLLIAEYGRRIYK